MFVSAQRPQYTEAQAREAIAAAISYTEALRRLGMRPAGGNHRTLRRYAEVIWCIPTDHFDPRRARIAGLRRDPIPLEQVLVEDSTYDRTLLKRRLLEAGLKQRRCELCGQGELWQGRRMSLILDHINGEATDNRLENLRIVCANCNATLDTHCGRNRPRGRPPRGCEHCGGLFRAGSPDQRFCSRTCSSRFNAPALRVVERPPTDELLAAIAAEGYEAVARRLGVSSNAIRKWLRLEGLAPPPGPGRTLHPPPVRRHLSDAQVREALALIAAGETDRAVADRFGVSRWSIRDVRRGRSYRHVQRPPPGSVAA